MAQCKVAASRYRQPLRLAAGRVARLDEAIRRLRRSGEIAALQAQVERLQEQLAAAAAEPRGAGTDGGANARSQGSTPGAERPPVPVLVPPSVVPFLTEAPPGHFYSPVPDLAEIDAQADRLFTNDRPLPGVALRAEEQLRLFGSWPSSPVAARRTTMRCRPAIGWTTPTTASGTLR